MTLLETGAKLVVESVLLRAASKRRVHNDSFIQKNALHNSFA
ncbi:hypothetical protein DOY81_005410 [Sarcophaga bullata]|nr:hypothetical protein DOY81_005410 [Sarcophaga bullata]